MRPIYKIFFILSVFLTISAVVVTVVIWRATGGSFLSADFRGGSVLELKFEKGRPAEAITIPDTTVIASGDKNIIIRSRVMNDAQRQDVIKKLSAKYGAVTQERFDEIGPTVGSELKTKSIKAIFILLAAIIVYISLVFRTMKRALSPWILGVAAVLALLHDVIIPIGVFSILGQRGIVEITAVFVAAALTILGYSVSDTVVVFDRIRENVIRLGGKEPFADLVHKSVLQTLTRSINTSMTTLLALVAIFFFGGASIKYFALALIIGIISGTYSSIFVASPIVMWWHGRKDRN